MSRIVVTGGAGFIGSHLCEALLEGGHAVAALDSFDEFYDPAAKRENIRSCIDHSRFRLIEGDIRDEAAVKSALGDGPEVLVHLAARAGVRPSLEQPLLYQDVNVRGTLVLLEAVRRVPGCRVVFASSSSVYGNRRDVPFRESDRVDDPISPYAATKKAGELLCHTWHHLYGIPITCLRFFTVYGPRQRPDLAIHKFARLIEAGRPVTLFGDGSMQRDFTYIGDIVDGVIRAIDRPKSFSIYNLGNERPVSVSELISLLEEALGKKARIERQPVQPGDVERTFADVNLARRDLGYEPRTEMGEGLARFVEWLRRTMVQS